MVVLTASCGGATPTSGPAPATAAEVSTPDVTVSLALDRSITVPGEKVVARLTVWNRSPRSVLWRGNGCGLGGAIVVEGPVEAVQPGAVDPAPDLRDRLLPGAERPVDPTSIDPPEVGNRCRLDHGFSLLEPGQHLVHHAAWPATTILGAPVAPGRYSIIAAFPAIAPGTPIDPPGYRAERDGRPVEVRLRVEVAGPASSLTAAQAMDRFLADAAFASWLGIQPPASLAAGLRYRDGTWVLSIAVAGRGVASGELSGTGGRPTFRFEHSTLP